MLDSCTHMATVGVKGLRIYSPTLSAVWFVYVQLVCIVRCRCECLWRADRRFSHESVGRPSRSRLRAEFRLWVLLIPAHCLMSPLSRWVKP